MIRRDYPGTERFPLGGDIEAIPVLDAARELAALK